MPLARMLRLIWPTTRPRPASRRPRRPAISRPAAQRTIASREGWLPWLLTPTTPAFTPDTLRANPLALLLMAACLVVQVVARYQFGFLYDERWLAVHLLIAFTASFSILVWFHGTAWLKRVSPQSWLVLVSGALCFCGFWYLGRVDSWRRWFQPWVDPSFPMAPLWSFFYFSASGVFFRMVLPLLFARRFLGLRPRDLGVLPSSGSASAPHRLWPLYLAAFLIVLPFVIHAAGTPAFLRKYPLCHDLLASASIPVWQFVLYQVAYVFVFVSGESFWRGYLTFGTERDFGMYAIALMIIPYVTAHFGKPLPETLGAILAGSVLGYLALKHRSVWLGVAVHYGVALTMDLLALYGRGVVLT
jgi:membrane protease YdiL (CAAX protease family)